jgi:hypothetical protein
LRNAQSAQALSLGLQGLPASQRIYALFADGTTLYAGTQNQGAFVSRDSGATWTALNDGFSILGTTPMPGQFETVSRFAIHGRTLFAVSGDNLWKRAL